MKIIVKKGIAGLFCLCLGFLSGIVLSVPGTRAETAADMEGAKKAVIQAYQNYQEKVDLSAYHISHSRDTKALGQMMEEVINQTPGLFYAGMGYSKYVVVETDRVRGLELEYADSFRTEQGKVDVTKIKKVQAKIDHKVRQIFAAISPGMTKLEKALFLHDYLVQNTQYLEDGKAESRYSEWGALVKGKANCQGYSMAYGLLMQEAGIPVRYISSASMKHMWNMIQLDGKWYHVDVTWDDPLDTIQNKDQFGLVLHDRFLCSTARMKKLDYYGFQGKLAKSRNYDKKYWRNVMSGFVYRKGQWLYQTGSQIKERKNLSGGRAKNLYAAGGNYFIPKDQDNYYFINYNRIYLYHRNTNSIEQVLQGSDYYQGDYFISQLRYRNGRLTYRVIRVSLVKTVTKRVKKDGLLK